MDEGLSAGAYESLHTHALNRALRAVPDVTAQFGEVGEADAPEVLARHVADAVRRALREDPHDQRLEKINDLLARSPCPACRYAPSRIRNGSWRHSRPSAPCTTGTATSSSPPPEPARRWSPP